MIKTDNLTKIFDKNTIAVNQLNLQVKKGELFGLVGPDGAGKTTTIRLLTSIMDPTSGHAYIDGKETVKESELIKEEIGYMSQRFGLYQDLTVIENLKFYADIYGVTQKEYRTKLEKLLAFSQLNPFKERLAANLSGGMKQKLGLACALIHTPKILFLDEPTTGVDPISRQEFWEILHQLLQEGVTIFVSTAYMDEAERCQRVGFMYEGSLLTVGSPNEIINSLPDKVIEVSPDNPRQATILLKEQLGDQSVTLFGNRIHILTTNVLDTKKIVNQLLPHASLKEIRPKLEDVLLLYCQRNSLWKQKQLL